MYSILSLNYSLHVNITYPFSLRKEDLNKIHNGQKETIQKPHAKDILDSHFI